MAPTRQMVLSILLAAQGFHSVEHVTQWLQFHVLNWSARASTGLLSAANAEWVLVSPQPVRVIMV